MIDTWDVRKKSSLEWIFPRIVCFVVHVRVVLLQFSIVRGNVNKVHITVIKINFSKFSESQFYLRSNDDRSSCHRMQSFFFSLSFNIPNGFCLPMFFFEFWEEFFKMKMMTMGLVFFFFVSMGIIEIVCLIVASHS